MEVKQFDLIKRIVGSFLVKLSLNVVRLVLGDSEIEFVTNFLQV